MNPPAAEHNIAHALVRQAAARPEALAVRSPRSFNYRELDQDSARLAGALRATGITTGMSTLLMVPPGPDFLSLTYALFKCGAVVVLIDPGMGRSQLLGCIRQTRPRALVGIPRAQAASLLHREAFAELAARVTVGRRWCWGGETLRGLRCADWAPLAPHPVTPDTPGAILFTTGSTGPPKGVVYNHGHFTAQVELIRTGYGITPGDIDLPIFAPFALFSVAMGMSVVFPDLDPIRPAAADPARIIDQIQRHQVSFSFGTPTLWARIGQHARERGLRLPSLRRVLMAGAPVRASIHDDLLGGVLSEGARTHTPYGATEALPVCDITGAEVLRETAARTARGAGICVGRPLPGMAVEIMPITDGPVETWEGVRNLPPEAIGEIVVHGPVVTAQYHDLPEQTRRAKIPGTVIRHRMGDAGYLDGEGRLWFCGRVAQRVQTVEGTLYPVRCEAIFNAHPDVQRAALVGLGDPPAQTPAIIIEPRHRLSTRRRRELARELLTLAQAHPVTMRIGLVYFHPRFPTDIRHNAKIFRERLKAWAQEQGPAGAWPGP